MPLMVSSLTSAMAGLAMATDAAGALRCTGRPLLISTLISLLLLAEASVLVVILLYVFLGNLRSALVVTCILPLSALSTFILMHYFGLSANLMSLGGLAIAIGELVDDA